MKVSSLTGARAWVLAAGLLACGKASDGEVAGTTGQDDTAGSSGGVPSTTGAVSTTTSDPATADADSGNGMDDANFLDKLDMGTARPGPDGSPCAGGGDCESGFCLMFMMGGVCSECLMDVDCGMGTCSFEFDIGYAVCTDGELGDGCDSDEGCMGALICEPLLNVGGGFSPQYCSECGADTPCAPMQTCSPVYGDSAFQGHRACVDAGTVDLGGGCNVDDMGMGDGTVCMSGICGVATLGMAGVDIGVCSECEDDGDCTLPAVCEPAMVTMAGVTAGACM